LLLDFLDEENNVSIQHVFTLETNPALQPLRAGAPSVHHDEHFCEKTGHFIEYDCARCGSQ
jgi:hypothetical protein